MNLAIIGASGNVGRKTIEILEKSKISFDKLFLVASSKSSGKKITFKGKEIEIEDLNNYDFSKAQITFWIFAGLMGLSLSSILLVYTGMSVTRVFFICSATFGAMSIYGYTTKRDLTKLGSFLMMGLIGIIIASIVNIFLKSSMMYFVISILGVLIFVGLTAYDTQKIKNMYAASDTGEIMGKKAVMGALTLYLDFINLFIMLLRLFGQRR